MPRVIAAEGMKRDITSITFHCIDVFSTSCAIEKKLMTVIQAEWTVLTLENYFTVNSRC